MWKSKKGKSGKVEQWKKRKVKKIKNLNVEMQKGRIQENEKRQ